MPFCCLWRCGLASGFGLRTLFTPVSWNLEHLSIAVWVIGLPLYAFSGQWGLTRYVGSRSLYQLAMRNGLLVVTLDSWCAFEPMPPRSSWLLLWLLLTGFTGAVRFGLRDVLLSLCGKSKHALTRVAIYGAGSAGVQLMAALRLANSHSVEVFLDDDPALWRRSINGVSIEPPQVLQQWGERLDQVLLAIPSLSRSRRRQILTSAEAGFLSCRSPLYVRSPAAKLALMRCGRFKLRSCLVAIRFLPILSFSGPALQEHVFALLVLVAQLARNFAAKYLP